MESAGLQTVLAYHQATKHHFRAFARSAGYLDWAMQPEPFRRYAGADRIPLAQPPPGDGPTYRAAMRGDNGPAKELDAEFVARLFRDSLSISAWKQLGAERWALRVNPSSGNLHPTEGYLVCGPVPGLTDTACVAHYAPCAHALEIRARFPDALWRDLAKRLPSGAVLVGLSSILWREAWKYGERAYRYCQHDVGHALAALAIAAAGLSWRARLVPGIAAADLAQLLGLADSRGDEKEYADCLVVIDPGRDAHRSLVWTDDLKAQFEGITWRGEPNRLSQSHRQWPLIHQVARAVEESAVMRDFFRGQASEAIPDGSPVVLDQCHGSGGDDFGAGIALRGILHRRRSAVAMDGHTRLDLPTFTQMLVGLHRVPGVRPFAVLPWEPAVHLFFFVHRVDDLEPGLYCLVRRREQLPELRRATRREFAWQVPPGCPAELGFHQLQAGDLRDTARLLSCGQDIAADGCFSLAMVADFAGSLQRHGAGFYNRLFWECGLIGQVLYLQAEVANLQGTGIGCYFDDPVHELLGFQSDTFQSLYHFTVGGAVDDPRITTLPPYPSV